MVAEEVRTVSRVSGLNHVTLALADLARAVCFYRDVLGLVLRAEWPKGAHMEAGSLWLCLSLDPQARTAPHLAFDVAEVDFEALSVRVSAATEAWKENRSEGRSLHVLDPDGHKLELHVGTLASRLEHLRQRPPPGLTIHER